MKPGANAAIVLSALLLAIGASVPVMIWLEGAPSARAYLLLFVSLPAWLLGALLAMAGLRWAGAVQGRTWLTLVLLAAAHAAATITVVLWAPEGIS